MNSCVIAFSHSNYLIKPTGTEKCIRELSDVLSNHHVVTIQVFSMYNKFSRLFKNQMVGVNFGKKFIGIYKLEDLACLIDNICKKNDLCLTGIHIHHLMNFDLTSLQKYLEIQKLPVCFFIHDYYTICTSTNMIDSQGSFCGVSFPSDEKCTHCTHFKNASQVGDIRKFVSAINSTIESVLVPSTDVYSRWTPLYPELKSKTFVRGHLAPQGCYKREYFADEKINIAFVGSQIKLKGFEEWGKFVTALSDQDLQYEFHYFGHPEIKHRNVINHSVSTATGGKDAMITSLRECRIDFVFLWSQWPETYSYVYYEASAAGTVVVTNPISGNVAAMVEKYGNGVIFKGVDDAIHFFKEQQVVSNFLKKHINELPFAPEHLNTNADIDMVLPVPKSICLTVIPKKIRPLRLPTFMYTRKHKLSLGKV